MFLCPPHVHCQLWQSKVSTIICIYPASPTPFSMQRKQDDLYGLHQPCTSLVGKQSKLHYFHSPSTMIVQTGAGPEWAHQWWKWPPNLQTHLLEIQQSQQGGTSVMLTNIYLACTPSIPAPHLYCPVATWIACSHPISLLPAGAHLEDIWAVYLLPPTITPPERQSLLAIWELPGLCPFDTSYPTSMAMAGSHTETPGPCPGSSTTSI